MSNESNKKLIYDFVDGQLSTDQIQRAEELMAKHPELAALHEALCNQQVRLRSLPEYSLDDSFADQVVRKAQAEGLFERKTATESTGKTNVSSSTTSATTQTNAPKIASSQPPNSFANWRSAAAAIVALAALLLVTLFIRPPAELDQPSVAAKTEPTASESTTSEPQLEPSGEKPGGAQPGEEQASKPESFSDDDRRALPLEDLKNAAIQAVPSMNSPGGGGAGAGGDANLGESKKDVVEADAMSQPKVAAALRMPPKSRTAGSTSDEPGVDDPMVMADGLSVPGNTPSQILLVNLDRDDQSLELLEKTFRSNGLQLNWSPDYNSDGINGISNRTDRFEPSDFAFNVRTTPAKMKAMMMELNNRGDVLGIVSNEFNLRADQLAAAQGHSSNQLSTVRIRRQSAAKKVQPGASRSAVAEGSDRLADKQPDSQAIQELNRFFRLEAAEPAKEEGAQQAQAPLQSYTLVIRFQPSSEPQSRAQMGGFGQEPSIASEAQPEAAAIAPSADEAKPAKE